MKKATPEQQTEIQRIRDAMRKRAASVGPLHAWWYWISDLEAIVEDRETMLSLSIEEYIKECQKELAKSENLP